MLSDSKSASNIWRNMPVVSFLIVLAAVFCTFSTIGFVADISTEGRQPTILFFFSTLLSGLFPVVYAYVGFTRRGRFWMAFIPLLAAHFAVMTWLNHRFPMEPATAQLNAAQTAQLERRLHFDSVAIIIAISVGYAGFVIAFVREGRRHIRLNAEKAALENEMKAAGEIQHLILPESSETFPGFRVDSVYTPSQQVGGDFFQILPDGSGGILAVIGDVAGKGLPAAMLVSMLVGSIRTAAEGTTDPARILHALHERLIGRTRGGFSTALAVHIAKDGSVNIANAGHLPPCSGGKEIPLPGALPLGIPGGGKYETTSLTLAPGGRFTFYTDGVVEAQNANRELFGFDRAQAISTHSAAEIAEAAVHFGQSDDITVVTIERLPA